MFFYQIGVEAKPKHSSGNGPLRETEMRSGIPKECPREPSVSQINGLENRKILEVKQMVVDFKKTYGSLATVTDRFGTIAQW